MIAIEATPKSASSVKSRTRRTWMAFTYGQWLQMNITTVPLVPRTSSKV